MMVTPLPDHPVPAIRAPFIPAGHPLEMGYCFIAGGTKAMTYLLLLMHAERHFY